MHNLNLICIKTQLIQGEADNVVGITTKATDTDLFSLDLFGRSEIARHDENIRQQIRHAADDFDFRTLKVGVDDRGPARKKQI